MKNPKISRRKFLAGVGVGTAAGAVTLPQTAFGAIIHPTTVQPQTTNNFNRLFPTLAPFVANTAQSRAAMADIGKPGGILDAKDDHTVGPIRLITEPALSPNNKDNGFLTAGMTFLGQFLDHDMTFDTTSFLGVTKAPEVSPNARTPSLDLDTVYGGGPSASPQLYQADRIHLKIESGGLF